MAGGPGSRHGTIWTWCLGRLATRRWVWLMDYCSGTPGKGGGRGKREREAGGGSGTTGAATGAATQQADPP